MKKFFIWFLAGLLVLELLLQLSVFLFSAHGSFTKFLPDIKQRIKQAEGKTALYFVGDSTIFGIGASNIETQALPPQLEKLLQNKHPQIVCINTGYAGTSTADHLHIFSLLPIGATVIYRGGSADTWVPPSGHLRFIFGGHLIEIRILKMLYLLFGRLFFPVVDYETSLSKELQEIMRLRQLKVFLLDYSSYPLERFSKLFWQNSHLFQHIPLHEYLQQHGYLKEDGLLKAEYLGMTGTHPNDIGYFLEAFFIFNHFCEVGLFGLAPADKLSIGNLNHDILSSQLRRLAFLRQEMQSLTPAALQAKGAFSTIGDIVYEAWNLANTLAKTEQVAVEGEFISHKQLGINGRQSVDATEILPYKTIAAQLKKLALLVFHDVRVAHELVGRMTFLEQQFFSDRQASLYYLVMKATEEADSASWGLINRVLLFTDSQIVQRKISYLGQIAPYPLEKCEVFVQESGFSAAELSAQSEWESFFSIPYAFFKNKTVCDR